MTPRGQSSERAGAKLLPPGHRAVDEPPCSVLLQDPTSSQTDRDWRPRRAPGGSQLTQEETGIIWVQIRESPTNLGKFRSPSLSRIWASASDSIRSMYTFIYIAERSIVETRRNGERKFLTSAAAQSRLLSLLIDDSILFRRRLPLRTLE